LLETRGIDAIRHGLILQIAFAALVANRTIERMIDEQELHHAFAGLAHHRRPGLDLRGLAFRSRTAVEHRPGAARDRFRRPGNFDEAHTAVAGDRETLVETEARNLGARRLACLEQRVLSRNVHLGAVNDDLGHVALVLLAVAPQARAIR